MFWSKISLEHFSFLLILKRLVWVILTSCCWFPNLLGQSQLQVIVTWQLWRLCSQSNLVFVQSRNKKRKHGTVSVENCTAVCVSLICYCSVFYFSESNSTDCTWRLVRERETAVGLSCEIHGEHLTEWIGQRYSTEKKLMLRYCLT